MKKLSKILGLVLVLAMVFSLAVPAGAFWKDVETNFSDSASIPSNRKEAVDVVTKIGIVSGVSVPGATQTLIDPDGTLTRAQAAYFIDYVIAGATVIDKLSKPTTAPFSDVPVSHWASQAISYAAERGYIVGDGTGKFNPDKPVTDIEFGILALKAVGYLAAGEQTSTNWKFVGLTEGINRSILDKKLAKDLDTPAKRVDVIQYTFNALKAITVTYSEFTHDYINRQNVFDATSALNKSLGELNFKLTRSETKDDYGVGTHYWRLDNKTITGEYNTDSLLGSFVSGSAVTKNDLYKGYEWADYVNVIVNGHSGEKWVLATGTSGTPDYVAAHYAADLVKSDKFSIRGNLDPAIQVNTGATVDKRTTGVWTLDPDTSANNVSPAGYFVRLFDSNNDGEVDKVVISYEYLAKVKEVKAAASTVTIDLYDSVAGTIKTRTFTGVFAEDLEKGDYALVTPKNTSYSEYDNSKTSLETIDVVKASSITAKVESYTRVKLDKDKTYTLTVNGNTYAAASYYNLGQFPSLEKDTIIYLDSHDSVIGLEGANSKAGELKYLYVNSTDINPPTYALIGVGGKAYVTYTDGTSDIVNLPYKTSTKEYQINGKDADAVYGYDEDVYVGWYAYTVNSDGTVKLSNPAKTTATPIEDDDVYQVADVGSHDATSATGGTNNPSIAANGEYTYTEAKKAAISIGNPAGGAGNHQVTGYANATTILNINGTKSTGYSSFPKLSLKAVLTSAPTGQGADKSKLHVLLIKDDESPYQLTHVYIINTTSTSAVVAYAIITGEPKKADYTTDGVLYQILSSDGSPTALSVSETTANSHYPVGSIVSLTRETVNGVAGVLTIEDFITVDIGTTPIKDTPVKNYGDPITTGTFVEGETTTTGTGYIVYSGDQYDISKTTLIYNAISGSNDSIETIFSNHGDYAFLAYTNEDDVLALVVTDKTNAATIQAKIDAAVAKISAYSANSTLNPTPDLQDYLDVGAVATIGNLDAYNAAVAALSSATAVNSDTKIKAVVVAVNTKVTALAGAKAALSAYTGTGDAKFTWTASGSPAANLELTTDVAIGAKPADLPVAGTGFTITYSGETAGTSGLSLTVATGAFSGIAVTGTTYTVDYEIANDADSELISGTITIHVA